MLRHVLALLFLLCVSAVAHVSHLSLVRNFRTSDRPEDPIRIYTPEGKSLRMLSFGQSTTLADLYWLRFVQYVGTPELQMAGIPQAFDLANLITDLDPDYGYAYQAAGVVLNSARRIDESSRILRKGMENVPGRWQLPFHLSFNYWYEQNDIGEGARLLTHAAALPNAPRYLPGLVSRLYSAAGRTDAAKAFLEHMLRDSSDPAAREQIQQRLLALHIETDLVTLERAVGAYRNANGRFPDDLQALVGPTLFAVPVAPDGSHYRYDPSTGEVLPPEGKRLGRPVETAVKPAKVQP